MIPLDKSEEIVDGLMHRIALAEALGHWEEAFDYHETLHRLRCTWGYLCRDPLHTNNAPKQMEVTTMQMWHCLNDPPAGCGLNPILVCCGITRCPRCGGKVEYLYDVTGPLCSGCGGELCGPDEIPRHPERACQCDTAANREFYASLRDTSAALGGVFRAVSSKPRR